MNQFLLSISLGLVTSLFPAWAIAQVEQAIGSSTTVNTVGTVVTITNGIPNGTNLFHSFERFSPGTDKVIFDNTANNALNIFGRVLGNTPSLIDGELTVTGTSANLYLINPNGFNFGSNARLGTGINSFSATTATSILFPGVQFTTINPDLTATLSAQVPTALEFRRENGRIEIVGSGHNLSGVTITSLGSNTTTTNSLGVGSDQTLTIVGSGVELQGGNLSADGGRIEVGSVAARTAIGINADLSLDYTNVQAFKDITLVNEASIDTSGSGGGAIQVQGQNISLSGGSNIVSITEGADAGETVTVKAAGQLSVDGFAGFIPTGIVTRNRNNINATGSSGDLKISASQLSVTGGAQIAAGTFRDGGPSGDITINVDSMQLRGRNGTAFYGPSGIYNRAFGSASGGAIQLSGNRLIVDDGALISTRAIRTGDSGSMNLNFTGKIQLQNEGRVTASTLIGSGNGGAIALATERLTLDNADILAVTDQKSEGNAGRITTIANQISLNNNSEISTSTFTEGAGGDVTVKADAITLDGVSRIATQVGADATGDGGRIAVDTSTLQLNNGSQILANTLGQGAGGEVSVIARDSVMITGTAPSNAFSGIVAQVEPNATGSGGQISLRARNLTLTEGGVITGGTIGGGSAGSVKIDVEDKITIQGENTAIAARTRTEQNAGNLAINTTTLEISDSGTVTVAGFNPNGPSGNAGNLTINARYIRLNNNASITGATTSGQGGNLDLNAMHIILLFNSEISTTAGTAGRPGDGGNIAIDAATVTGLFNSDIASNSFQGRGGRIVITAQGIFGLEFRLERTPENDITAISLFDPQLNGEVVLNTPNIDPTQALIEVPVVESPEVVRQICRTVRPGNNPASDIGTFRLEGRSLPTSPTDTLRVGRIQAQPIASSRQPTRSARDRLIAQGWGRNASGELVLTAQAPKTQHVLLSAVQCGI